MQATSHFRPYAIESLAVCRRVSVDPGCAIGLYAKDPAVAVKVIALPGSLDFQARE